MAALIAGTQRRIVLLFEGADGDGKRRATKFQHRIHTLRSRMREENHPDHEIAARATVSLYWGPKAVSEASDKVPSDWKDDHLGKRGAVIIIRPKDSEFDDILRNIGVDVPKTEAPKPYIVPSTPSAAEQASLDAFMDELTSNHGEPEREP